MIINSNITPLSTSESYMHLYFLETISSQGINSYNKTEKYL